MIFSGSYLITRHIRNPFKPNHANTIIQRDVPQIGRQFARASTGFTTLNRLVHLEQLQLITTPPPVIAQDHQHHGALEELATCIRYRASLEKIKLESDCLPKMFLRCQVNQ
jgi:hypothetical protein